MRSTQLETLRLDHAKLVALAKLAPMDVGRRVALLAAEWARLEGREPHAMRAFDQALSAARRNASFTTRGSPPRPLRASNRTAELEKANRELDAIAFSMSHDLPRRAT